MARIRSIKPEFWTSEQVMGVSPMARLLFIGLWNFCDDGGVHVASPITLKAEVFPADAITVPQVQEWVEELIAAGLMLAYENTGKAYWHITGWHHQKIDQPTFRHPQPDGSIPDGAPKRAAKSREASRKHAQESADNPQNTQQPFVDVTAKHSRSDADVSPPEWSGVESKGVESKGGDSGVPTASTELTRVGGLCKTLRAMGIDAAPHLAAWKVLLPDFSDEEIVSAAAKARDSKPGERLHLNYIVPILKDRGGGKPRRDIHAERAETIAKLTGANRNERSTANERDITGESVRVA